MTGGVFQSKEKRELGKDNQRINQKDGFVVNEKQLK